MGFSRVLSLCTLPVKLDVIHLHMIFTTAIFTEDIAMLINVLLNKYCLNQI